MPKHLTNFPLNYIRLTFHFASLPATRSFTNRFSNWIDIEALTSTGITVIDTSRGMTPSVAEFALAMTLNLIRHIPESLYATQNGDWRGDATWNHPDFVYGDLTGRRVGLPDSVVSIGVMLNYLNLFSALFRVTIPL